MNLLKQYIRSVLLTEISKESYEKMLAIAKESPLPFSDMMGGKLRVSVPFFSEESKVGV